MDYAKETIYTEGCIINLFGYEPNQCFFWSINFKDYLQDIVYSNGFYCSREIALGKAYKIAFYIDKRIAGKAKQLEAITRYIHKKKGIIKPSSEYDHSWDISIDCPEIKNGLIHYDVVKGWTGTPSQVIVPLLISVFSGLNL
jgi:hypothetical protein